MPNSSFTGLFTIAPSCGCTKKTRGREVAGGAAESAGGASAPPHAVAKTQETSRAVLAVARQDVVGLKVACISGNVSITHRTLSSQAAYYVALSRRERDAAARLHHHRADRDQCAGLARRAKRRDRPGPRRVRLQSGTHSCRTDAVSPARCGLS